jgi:hypothetical protein
VATRESQTLTCRAAQPVPRRLLLPQRGFQIQSQLVSKRVLGCGSKLVSSKAMGSVIICAETRPTGLVRHTFEGIPSQMPKAIPRRGKPQPDQPSPKATSQKATSNEKGQTRRECLLVRCPVPDPILDWYLVGDFFVGINPEPHTATFHRIPCPFLRV